MDSNNNILISPLTTTTDNTSGYIQPYNVTWNSDYYKVFNRTLEYNEIAVKKAENGYIIEQNGRFWVLTSIKELPDLIEKKCQK